ncbi:unnamed protein product [Cylindrotheca closterium]|uniref:Uncharacterized protein n=1 Tax=Cylindrotheca closterium TaxID=2856 RepID=A0AAD2JKX1_9STRA|nr:unnamed protein product [Cylindrotheca closterium]
MIFSIVCSVIVAVRLKDDNKMPVQTLQHLVEECMSSDNREVKELATLVSCFVVYVLDSSFHNAVGMTTQEHFARRCSQLSQMQETRKFPAYSSKAKAQVQWTFAQCYNELWLQTKEKHQRRIKSSAQEYPFVTRTQQVPRHIRKKRRNDKTTFYLYKNNEGKAGAFIQLLEYRKDKTWQELYFLACTQWTEHGFVLGTLVPSRAIVPEPDLLTRLTPPRTIARSRRTIVTPEVTPLLRSNVSAMVQNGVAIGPNINNTNTIPFHLPRSQVAFISANQQWQAAILLSEQMCTPESRTGAAAVQPAHPQQSLEDIVVLVALVTLTPPTPPTPQEPIALIPMTISATQQRQAAILLSEQMCTPESRTGATAVQPAPPQQSLENIVVPVALVTLTPPTPPTPQEPIALIPMTISATQQRQAAILLSEQMCTPESRTGATAVQPAPPQQSLENIVVPVALETLTPPPTQETIALILMTKRGVSMPPVQEADASSTSATICVGMNQSTAGTDGSKHLATPQQADTTAAEAAVVLATIERIMFVSTERSTASSDEGQNEEPNDKGALDAGDTDDANIDKGETVPTTKCSNKKAKPKKKKAQSKKNPTAKTKEPSVIATSIAIANKEWDVCGALALPKGHIKSYKKQLLELGGGRIEKLRFCQLYCKTDLLGETGAYYKEGGTTAFYCRDFLKYGGCCQECFAKKCESGLTVRRTRGKQQNYAILHNSG